VEKLNWVGTCVVTILWLTVLVAWAGVQPQAEHGLHYQTPATVWDEAMPLGNGLFGALVWGDGKRANWPTFTVSMTTPMEIRARQRYRLDASN